MNSLRDVLALLNEMQIRGVVHDYAISGATAALAWQILESGAVDRQRLGQILARYGLSAIEEP